MKDTGSTGNYYTINHITLFTGLTDRTIRSYIALGILQGEKINGLWHFTPEQVEDFILHPAVKPSILAKKNAIIYDFMADNHKSGHEICTILDLPGDNEKKIAEYFSYTISNGDFRNIRFSFDTLSGIPRVILRGDVNEVLSLIDRYYEATA